MHSVVNTNLPSSTDVNISTSAETCGESNGLRILDEFRRLYEGRIEKIDRELGTDCSRASMKLQIMSDWIKDLGEQNAMLVHTVEDLEQAAYDRVKLLEEKLKQSSQIVAENMMNSNYSKERLITLSNHITQLQKAEMSLRQKIEYLQNDIKGLLELIERVRSRNLWSLDGIKFFEIQHTDIPLPLDCSCDQEQVDVQQIKSGNLEIEEDQENEKKMMRYQLELEKKVADLTTELLAKDEALQKYVSTLRCFCDKLKEHSKFKNHFINHPLTVTSVQDHDIMLMPDILESILVEKDTENKKLHCQLQHIKSKCLLHSCESNIDTNNLHVQLNEKCKEIKQLQEKVVHLEKDALEAVEIRKTLMGKMAVLENQNYHANIGNDFKDNVIKEMRKRLKQVALEKTFPTFYPCTHNVCNNYDTDTKHITKLACSSHKFHQQFPDMNPLCELVKNNLSFIHNNSKSTLDHRKSKLQNGSFNSNLQNRFRNRVDTQTERLKDIDKKIVRTAKKLSYPGKNRHFHDEAMINASVFPIILHFQEKPVNMTPK